MLHGGVFGGYLTWVLVGLVVIVGILLKR